MRGARVYPTEVEDRALAMAPDSTSRDLNPGRGVPGRAARPRRTMVRFSPVSSITSATVPRAVRSAYCPRSSSVRPGPAMAMATFRATPTPARCLKG